jgi:hypothetical protein
LRSGRCVLSIIGAAHSYIISIMRAARVFTYVRIFYRAHTALVVAALDTYNSKSQLRGRQKQLIYWAKKC